MKPRGQGIRSAAAPARQSHRADTSCKEQQCSGMAAYASGAAELRTSIEFAFAPEADYLASVAAPTDRLARCRDLAMEGFQRGDIGSAAYCDRTLAKAEPLRQH
jgi:hypothetical protein